MLSTGSTQVSAAHWNRDLFIESFFSFTTVYAAEREDRLNIGRLLRLQQLGYTIDKVSVVFGRFGTYWPLLRDSSGGVVLRNLTIGNRGSSGSADLSLTHYLHLLMSKEGSKRGGVPCQEADAVAISRTLDAQASPQPAKTSVNLGYPLVRMIAPRSLSLEEFQEWGIFKENPPPPVNTFREEELLGSTLTVFYTGKYMIHNRARILACSFDLKINGNKEGPSDVPCSDAVRLQAPLEDKELLQTILPYLQGIPLYQS